MLSPHISQGDYSFPALRGNRCDAGDLAHIFAVATDRTTRLGRALNFKTREHTMNRAPRANAFYDFLSDVTAFIEIQSAVLAGFLRQSALANVCPDLRNAAQDAKRFEG